MMRRRIKIAEALLLSMGILLSGCTGSQDRGTDNEEATEQETKETVQEDTNASEVPQELTVQKAPIFVSEGIRRIQILAGDKVEYSIEYAPGELENSYEYWKMAVPYENKVIVDTEAMTTLYDLVESLDFTPVQTAADADTGLDSPTGEIELEFCQTTSKNRIAALTEENISSGEWDSTQEKETMSAACADSRCTLLVGNSHGDGSYYTALESMPEQIYKMNSSVIDSIIHTSPFSLILKVGNVAAVNTVEEVNIAMDQSKYQMSSKDDIYYLGNDKIDETSYHSLYTELLSVLVDSEFIPLDSTEEPPLLEMEFVRNRDKGKDVLIQYYPYDEEYAVLSQDGVKNFLVKMEDVNRLKETIKGAFK